MHNRYILLTHPFYLLGVFLLLFNDQVLKEAYPSVVTGKLSDFAGLFVVGVLAGLVTLTLSRSRGTLIATEVTTGILFVIWKIAPIEPWLRSFNQTIGYPWLERTVDATDLIALPMLAAAYVFVQRGGWRPRLPCRLRRVSLAAVLLTSGFAIVATTPLPLVEAESHPGITLSTRAEAYERTLFDVEQVLAERGVAIATRWNAEDGRILLEGAFDSERSAAWRTTFPKKEVKASAYITLLVREDRTIQLATVRLDRHGHHTQTELEEAAQWIVSGFTEFSQP